MTREQLDRWADLAAIWLGRVTGTLLPLAVAAAVLWWLL